MDRKNTAQINAVFIAQSAEKKNEKKVKMETIYKMDLENKNLMLTKID